MSGPETRLPLSLLTAVARVESEFQSGATSSAGARGLLQVLPTTAAELELDVEHPDAEQSSPERGTSRLQFDRFPLKRPRARPVQRRPDAVANEGAAPSDETLTSPDVTSIWRSLAGCS